MGSGAGPANHAGGTWPPTPTGPRPVQRATMASKLRETPNASGTHRHCTRSVPPLLGYSDAQEGSWRSSGCPTCGVMASAHPGGTRDPVGRGAVRCPGAAPRPGVSKMSDGAPAVPCYPWQRDWGIVWNRAAPEQRNAEAREKGEAGSSVFILPAAGNFSRPVSICGDVTCAAWCCSVQA